MNDPKDEKMNVEDTQKTDPNQDVEKMNLGQDLTSQGSGTSNITSRNESDFVLDAMGLSAQRDISAKQPRLSANPSPPSLADLAEACSSQDHRSFTKPALHQLKSEAAGSSQENEPIAHVDSLSSQCSAIGREQDPKRNVLKKFTHRRQQLRRSSTDSLPDANFWVNPRVLSEYPHFVPIHTHRKSLLIRAYHCFEVSSHKVPADERLRKNLGICVQFKSKTCNDKNCTPCTYKDCNVCPHLYTCDCKAKFKDTNWCTHIHVMAMMHLSVFENHVCLFINTTKKLMQMRHLQAFVMGKMEMMAVEENVYVEFFDDLRHSTRYRVKVSPQPKCQLKNCTKCRLCSACYCMYQCNCMDYWLYKHVCEHCHNVAMLRHERRDQLFDEYEGIEQDFSDSEYETDAEARNLIENEHEVSFLIKLSEIKQIAPTRWRVPSTPEDFVEKRTIFLDARKTSLCVCTTLSRTECCLQCKICRHHYGCTCLLSDETICRHVHALHRFLETPKEESDEEYYRRIVEVEEGQFAMEDVSLREPIGPIIDPTNTLVDI